MVYSGVLGRATGCDDGVTGHDDGSVTASVDVSMCGESVPRRAVPSTSPASPGHAGASPVGITPSVGNTVPMTSTRGPSGPFSALSGWLAKQSALPMSVRATLRFHSRSGDLDLTSLRLRGEVEATLDDFLSDAYAAVEERIERELGYDDVSFSYETKLTLPVELTLGYVYYRALAEAPDGYDPVTDSGRFQPGDVVRVFESEERTERRLERLAKIATEQRELVVEAERIAELCTEALLDGDMQDAINDGEFEDFVVDRPLADDEREEVARIAQTCLHERVEAGFERFPDAVREQYEWAVERSNRHQEEDDAFRRLLLDAREGDEAAVEGIKERYRDPSVDEPESVLTEAERSLPYSKTQYERVGVIYAGMIEMFKACGIHVEDSFKRSIVLAIIGAQVWLDDIDDYEADVEEGQLTPVTAEYTIADSDREAYRSVVSVTESYLDRAVDCAIESGSSLTGIATEYIYLSGTPETLPGSE